MIIAGRNRPELTPQRMGNEMVRFFLRIVSALVLFCPLTATAQDSTGTGIVVTYSGTVCGVSVSGTENVKK